MCRTFRALPLYGRVCLLFLSLLSLSAFSAASAKTIYVNASVPGVVHDGLSWDTAFTGIQAACAAAAAADEIWVARGTYHEAVSITVPLGLYGGFSGNETARGQRDWQANATIIDGGHSGKVVETLVPAYKTWSTYYTAVIDGFAIRSASPGSGTGVAAGALNVTVSSCKIAHFGTGIAVTASGTVKIMGCTVRENELGIQCGGATCLIASNLVAGNLNGVDVTSVASQVINNTFINNTTGLFGDRTDERFHNNIFAWNGVGVGAIYASVAPTHNCVWANGTDYAGATDLTGANGNIRVDPMMVSASAGEVHLTAQSPCRDTGTSSFANSTYDLDGQARKLNGNTDIGADEYDGIARIVTPAIVRVKPGGDDQAVGSTWMLAKATVTAALDALWGHGGEIWLQSGTYDGSVLITSAIVLSGGFSGTETARSERRGKASFLDGAGADYTLSIRCLAGVPLVDGVFLRGGGSGLECSLGAPVVQNSVVAGNVEGATLSGSSPALRNLTIAENKRGVAMTGANPEVTNCVITANETGLSADATSAPAFQNDCIGANGQDFDGVTDPSGSNGNIYVDPLLASPRTGDLHLTSSSPCRDAGLNGVVDPNSRDLDGETRIQGARVDIGADEYDGNPPVVSTLVVRVAPDGDDSRDGATWDNAKRTIQAAVDAASSGGEVWVASGTYSSNSRLRAFTHLYGGFAKTTVARDGRDPSANPTILWGDGLNPVVSVLGGNSATSLDGFVVQGGAMGVRLDGASPLISRNTLRNNDVAVEATNSSPMVELNKISLNTEGFRFDGGSPVIRANTITGNTFDGVRAWGGAPNVRDNFIGGNGVFGLMVSDGTATVTNNTFLGNATALGLAAALVTAKNNIVTGNLAAISQTDATPESTFVANCFWDNAQGFIGLTDPTGSNANIAVDPKLCSPAYGDIRLRNDTPCRDAGDTSALLPDDIAFGGGARVFGPQVDIGADESTGGSPAASPVVVRVNAITGNDANDGLSWGAAKQTVQAGLDAAFAVGGDVWVASGTYAGGVTLRPFTSLRGGFRGSENALSERPGNPNDTILDGTALLNDIKIRGGYTFTVLDGFTVSGARTGVSAMNDASALTDNLVTANTNRGISVVGGATTVSHSRIIGNSVTASDYGINLDTTTASILNNIILDNAPISTSYGGGIGISGGAPLVANNLLAGNAYGVYLTAAAGILSNNTIVANKTGLDLESLLTTPVTIANNVIASNTSQGVYRASGTASPVFRSNNMWGTYWNYLGSSNPIGTNGNVSIDPLFRNVASRNYRLGAGSPLIDAGDDTFVRAGWTDLDGKPRILGVHVDMGAYEYTASTRTLADATQALKIAAGVSGATVSDVVLLDIAPNGRIDMADVVLVLRNAVGIDG